MADSKSPFAICHAKQPLPLAIRDMPFCYIVECVDGTLYTGWTTDVTRRVKMHNAGRGAKYTRMHRPVRLVYVEKLRTRSAAQKRELEIKRMPRAKKLAIIKNSK